ncbi:MAG TPA: nucleotidyltransferase family protein [Actinobacteria bacterium]|nr:nucleotidyltransferase family protein [Actinomycetota bacterium]
MEIVAVVLAAGAARRMGTPKQLLPVGGVPMVRRAAEAALGAGLTTVVVTGHHGDAVEAVLDDLPIRCVRNPDPDRGNRSSLLVGIEAAGDVEAIVLLLGDMPDVDVPLVETLVEAVRRERPWAAVTRYRTGRGHPFVLTREAIAGLEGVEGPKPLWRHLGPDAPGRVLEVPVDRDRPIDVDTPEDYEALGEG